VFFHLDVRHAFRHLGIDGASWERGYLQAWQAGYTLERHAQEICRQAGGERAALDKMQRIVHESFADLRRYLFPDVLPFLDRAKRNGVGLYLLSFGNPEWQRYKVLGAGLDRYFDATFFTAKEGGKGAMILERARECKQVLVVDNNPSELDVIKDVMPIATTYCINRVPDDMVIPFDEISRLKFLEARQYLERAWRHRHVPCTTLDEILAP
jgi:FMN phosphatase YigB (HAD superfamily)